MDDGVGGSDAWAALTRGRLRHLETLGLATRQGRRYRLHPDLEAQLRTLQVRRDIIRTLHQRRLESGREVRELGRDPVRGKVVKVGQHDEMGASAWVVVRGGDGQEHFAKLKVGQVMPSIGRTVELQATARGAQISAPARDLGRG